MVFGESFDLDRYSRVVRACGLEPDLDSFERGDETVVGDRGTRLSGGQKVIFILRYLHTVFHCASFTSRVLKARVNLARAVYRDADIYLLDDTLSSIDQALAANIFQDCILGLLNDKIVVLVTSQIHFLEMAEQANICVMEKGNLASVGTYQHLLNSQGNNGLEAFLAAPR